MVLTWLWWFTKIFKCQKTPGSLALCAELHSQKGSYDQSAEAKKQQVQFLLGKNKSCKQLYWPSPELWRAVKFETLQLCPKISCICCNVPLCPDCPGVMLGHNLCKRHIVPLVQLLQLLTKGGLCARKWVPCLVYSLQWEWSKKKGRDREMIWSNAAYQIKPYLPACHVITQLARTDAQHTLIPTDSRKWMQLKGHIWRKGRDFQMYTVVILKE